jgi:hypothetical protein
MRQEVRRHFSNIFGDPLLSLEWFRKSRVGRSGKSKNFALISFLLPRKRLVDLSNQTTQAPKTGYT